MIKFNMKKVISLRGITRPNAYLVKHGFVKTTASRILKGTITAPPDDLIERFCLLFHCVPHDFMEWYPETEEQARMQPLKILIPQKRVSPSLRKLIYEMPIDKLEDLTKKAEELSAGSD